jgi:hypothetical protein
MLLHSIYISIILTTQFDIDGNGNGNAAKTRGQEIIIKHEICFIVVAKTGRSSTKVLVDIKVSPE